MNLNDLVKFMEKHELAFELAQIKTDIKSLNIEIQILTQYINDPTTSIEEKIKFVERRKKAMLQKTELEISIL
jgi:hypothetical protein